MRLVIFKLNKLGDNVVFVPVVQALRRRFPDWRITLLTTPSEAELYGGPLAPDEVLVFPKQAFDKAYRRPWVLARWYREVRARHPDACLVPFDQGRVAHLLAKLSGAPTRVGAKLNPPRISGSLTKEVPVPGDGSAVTWSWSMARALAQGAGAADWEGEPQPPDLGHLLAKEARRTGTRRRVVVHAGASGPLNQWSVENFAAVAESLAHDCEVDWISHGGATGPAPRGTNDRPVATVRELARAISGADLFLGNNSGPMHLANALGCAGVAVTGSSARGWDPYWHRERWTVLRHPSLACAPCEAIDRRPAACANLGSPMACMTYWTPGNVEAACRERLKMRDSIPA